MLFFFGETRDAEDEKQEGEAWRYIWRTDGRMVMKKGGRRPANLCLQGEI
jgi:hypothetical protein